MCENLEIELRCIEYLQILQKSLLRTTRYIIKHNPQFKIKIYYPGPPLSVLTLQIIRGF